MSVWLVLHWCVCVCVCVVIDKDEGGTDIVQTVLVIEAILIIESYIGWSSWRAIFVLVRPGCCVFVLNKHVWGN